METGNAMVESSPVSAEDPTSKVVQKRYDGLTAVRNKAIKGKGAWYWTHLEPVLLRNTDTGLPEAVKLRCSLCAVSFSASNPSRTASEHLKRGTCPNFTSSINITSSVAPTTSTIQSSTSLAESISPLMLSTNRKRSSPLSYQVSSLAIIDPSRYPSSNDGYFSLPPESQRHQHHLVLSCGKEDLLPLAMLEESVKKLKSPKSPSRVALSTAQAESAISFLSDWVYESCGDVSLSSFDHPKFRAFLQQVGLPPISRRVLAGPRLDARYEELRCEAEARIHDALFFQVASNGWKQTRTADRMVAVTVNLPNGTSVFRKAVFTNGTMTSEYMEDILRETITGISDGMVQNCAGIVADRFKSKALRDLEDQNRWMVNLSCQLQGFNSLINDFGQDLPLFCFVATNCSKIAHFFNTKSQLRSVFFKYQLEDMDHNGLLQTVNPSPLMSNASGGGITGKDLSLVFDMIEYVMASYQALHSVVLDESYELVCVDDPIAREVADMIQDISFWGELEAVHSLVNLVRSMIHEMELERPFVGQCLPLWDELRSKVEEWCIKFNVNEGPVEKVIEKRFRKNYHPAWSAAFILDPFYLIKDPSGKYLPPFKSLTPEQEKDVDKLITRLVSPEEAHIVLMELMKWRSEGLDAVYAQAVQMKLRDPMTGKMKIANPQSSRLVWETYLSEFKLLRKVAVRLIFLQATACGFKYNPSSLRWIGSHRCSNAVADRAEKMIFIAANAKLERNDFSCEEEKDSDLFTDDMLNDVFADADSV